MEILIWIVGGIVALIATVGVNMASSELYDHCPRLARWLIGRAVRWLPQDQRERYEEEWSAHLLDCTGKLEQVSHALGCCWSSWKLARTPMAPASGDLVLPSFDLVIVGTTADGQQVESMRLYLNYATYLVVTNVLLKNRGNLPPELEETCTEAIKALVELGLPPEKWAGEEMRNEANRLAQTAGCVRFGVRFLQRP